MSVQPAEMWFKSLGPVTRSTFLLSIGLTAAVQFGFVFPHQLHLDWEAVSHRFQVWRLVTNMLYFGPFGITWLFNLAFYTIYHSKVEEQFKGRLADHVTMLLFTSTVLTVGAYVLRIPFLPNALLIMLVWVWCRTNEDLMVSFFGVVMPAPYFPWVLFAIHAVFGENFIHDVLGILAGHSYVYLAEILPVTHGYRLLRTPALLYSLFPPSGYSYRRREGRRVDD